MKLEILLKTRNGLEQKAIKIDNKILYQYSYGSNIKTLRDLNLYRSKSSENFSNISILHLTLPNAIKIHHELRQKSLLMLGKHSDAFDMIDNCILIEPSLEYLLYKTKSEREKLLEIKDLPESLRKILDSDSTMAQVSRLFKEDEQKEITKIIEWSMQKTIRLGASMPMPVCLPVGDERTLDWAFQTNRISQTIAGNNGWVESSFFNLDFSLFAYDDYLNVIAEFVKQMEPSIIFLKIRGCENLVSPDKMLERSNFYDFIQKIAGEGKMVFLLNTDSLGFVGYGFDNPIDCFTEPLDGVLNPDIRRKRTEQKQPQDGYARKFGKYLNPKDFMWWKFRALNKLYTNQNKTLPCSCQECSLINGKEIVDHITWNIRRRKHVLNMRNTLIEEARQTLLDGTTRGSFFDRFSKSPLNCFSIFFS